MRISEIIELIESYGPNRAARDLVGVFILLYLPLVIAAIGWGAK